MILTRSRIYIRKEISWGKHMLKSGGGEQVQNSNLKIFKILI